MRAIAQAAALALLTSSLLTAQGAPQAPGSATAQYAQRVRALGAAAFEKEVIGVRGLGSAVSTKMDPRLRQLLDESRRGADVRSRSIDLGASTADPRLPVLINAPGPERVAALEQEVRALNGTVMASHDASVWATLPVDGIDRIAASPNAHYVAVQERMELNQETASADASLRATKVVNLHRAGIRGRGVKIGIIDAGFGGYSKLRQAGRVPVPKAVRSFPASYVVENDTVHGAACAEIIFGMAPEADVYLAAIQPEQGNTIAAAQWLIAQGVDIISYSMGTIAQAGDGSGELARFVDDTTQQNGVLWMVSAGNAGMDHWSGINRDVDRDGLVETGPNRDDIGLELVPQSDEFELVVRWNDWGPNPRQPTSSQDIDAYLFLINAKGELEPVTKGVDTQAGGPGRPLEHLQVRGKGIKGKHFVLLLKNEKVTRELLVHVFIESSSQVLMQPRSASGSVASPASARYALAVGAWDAASNELAPYSSQGPTDDSRLKPEITAPAGLPSAAYAHVFHGTSAACPHAAGFAALIKQGSPELRGVALRTAVMRAVEPKGTPVPNMASGYGWIDGSRVPASVTRPTPVAGGAPSLPPPPGGTPPPASSTPPPAVGTSARTIALPMAWGGAIETTALDRLVAPSAPPAFLTRVTTARDLYRVGDGLKVGFVASEPCDYLLFHRSVRGEYTLLSPRGGSVARLTAGGAVVLPGDTETFEVTEPVGTEELVLVCARRALDLHTAGAATSRDLVVTRHRYEVVR